jgi:hypothetical protein
VSYTAAESALASGRMAQEPHDIQDYLSILLEHRAATRWDFVFATHPKNRKYREGMAFIDALVRHGLIIESTSGV